MQLQHLLVILQLQHDGHLKCVLHLTVLLNS
jgi:hypothetical protein